MEFCMLLSVPHGCLVVVSATIFPRFQRLLRTCQNRDIIAIFSCNGYNPHVFELSSKVEKLRYTLLILKG